MYIMLKTNVTLINLIEKTRLLDSSSSLTEQSDRAKWNLR